MPGWVAIQVHSMPVLLPGPRPRLHSTHHIRMHMIRNSTTGAISALKVLGFELEPSDGLELVFNGNQPASENLGWLM